MIHNTNFEEVTFSGCNGLSSTPNTIILFINVPTECEIRFIDEENFVHKIVIHRLLFKHPFHVSTTLGMISWLCNSNLINEWKCAFPTAYRKREKFLLMTVGCRTPSIHCRTVAERLVRYAYISRHYNPSVRIMTQVLLPLMLCALILYMSAGTYNVKAISNDSFSRETFHDFIQFLIKLSMDLVVRKPDFFQRAFFYQKKEQFLKDYIYVYIIGHCNPTVRIIDLVSHTTYVVAGPTV